MFMIISGEPTVELFPGDSERHLVLDELPHAIALYERLEQVKDARLPYVRLDAITEQTERGAEPRPEPGILDGIFD